MTNSNTEQDEVRLEAPDRISLNPSVAARYPVSDKRIGDVEYVRASVVAPQGDAQNWTDEFPQTEESLYWIRHKLDHANTDIARLRNGSLYPTDGGPMSKSRRRDWEYLPVNPPAPANALHLSGEQDVLVDEVQHRMDQVVEAAVEWHQNDSDNWAETADRLANAINSLLELRGEPGLMPRRWCNVHEREEFKYEALEHELHTAPSPVSATPVPEQQAARISFASHVTDTTAGGICPRCHGSIPTGCRCPLPCPGCGHVGSVVKGLCRVVVNELGLQRERRVCECDCYAAYATTSLTPYCD